MRSYVARYVERWNPTAGFFATFQAESFIDAVTIASLLFPDCTLIKITSEGA